ncbi:MAG: lipid-A-disaccharide synthase [Omnitrophica WOR_2 bacterium RIFCSPHIGHO2_02_FULL_52_10]|nr:MAG: lipid-A-disaccharide synthase [Omnitrophica WOR_2 bacterium RIFCSPHIGHO2_02_FULL_52_10]
MESAPNHLVLVAGEASGDMHAAHLVDAIKKLDPSVTFSGLGGPKMKASGVEIYQDLASQAVVGFWEVLTHYPEIRRAFELVLEKIDAVKPKAVLLVDFPGFNLRLARELKRRNIRVIYYISPQVWAWKEERVHFIKKHVDKMLVLFKFEKEFYAKHGINVEFVGHPLVDTLNITCPKDIFLENYSLPADHLTIGLLPGSRVKEIETLLPVMVHAAEILHRKIRPIQFLVMQAPTIRRPLLEFHLRDSPITHRIVEEDIYDGINACDFCLVASGTATLETALLQRPMIVVYKTHLLTWLLAKCYIKISDIGLVNIVAGRRIVPECVQFEANGQTIAEEAQKILSDEFTMTRIKKELRSVKEALGESGASHRAAVEVLKLLHRL